MRKCKYCGKEFKAFNPKQDYCSRECYEQDKPGGKNMRECKDWAEHCYECYEQIVSGGKNMRECEDCGEYCSRECYEQGESGGNIMSGLNPASKIMDTLMEETEEIMEHYPYDKVDRPMHYTAGSIETIDYIQSVTEQLLGFEAVCIGNALKYISRQHLKNGTEDLKKAIWYLNRLVEYKGE